MLLLVAVAKRDRLPSKPRTWGHLAIAALFLNTVPFTLFGYAELHISATLAGICNASSPLFSLLITVLALGDERPTAVRTMGLVVGFGGVLVVLGAWAGFSGVNLGGTALALGAAASYSLGWAYVRRFLSDTKCSALSLSTTQLLVGTAELAVLTPLFTDPPIAFPLDSVLSVLGLGVLGTGLAFGLQHALVRDAGATIAVMVTYLIPMVSTLAGVLILNEPLTWNTPVGAVIVLVGAALAQRGHPRSRRPMTPHPLRRRRGRLRQRAPGESR